MQRSVFFLKSIDVDSFDTVELINILSGTHIVLEGSQSVFFGFVGFLDYKLLKIGEKKKPNWIFVFEFLFLGLQIFCITLNFFFLSFFIN